jgi:hypothetical protein
VNAKGKVRREVRGGKAEAEVRQTWHCADSRKEERSVGGEGRGRCWKLQYTQCGFMLGSIKMSDFD